MYYKEVNTVTETEIDDGVEETEVSTTLSGVMVFDDKEFEVSGKKKSKPKATKKKLPSNSPPKARRIP